MKVLHGLAKKPKAIKKQGYYIIALPMIVWVAMKQGGEAKVRAEWIYNHEYAHILQWERGCGDCPKGEQCANHYATFHKLLC